MRLQILHRSTRIELATFCLVYTLCQLSYAATGDIIREFNVLQSTSFYTVPIFYELDNLKRSERSKRTLTLFFKLFRFILRY